MIKDNTWKQLGRKKVYSSKFVNVYEDQIQLPSGKIINNYTVVEKPDIVMVVATDRNNNLIILDEYKYAAGKNLLTLPAGHLEKNEKPVNAAKRELLEETGFVSDEFVETGILYEYATRDLHEIHVVRAKNIYKKSETVHEDTESISYSLISKEKLIKQIKDKKWQTSSAIAAITLSGILF